jgi:uncharacterized protein YfaS (alpha-2-macroglobulin family)
MSEYNLGNLVRCAGSFVDDSGTAITPETVSFSFKNPTGTIVTYLAGTDSELVEDSVGHYHVDVEADAFGVWYYRFFSTGAGTAASEKSFSVVKSEFS